MLTNKKKENIKNNIKGYFTVLSFIMFFVYGIWYENSYGTPYVHYSDKPTFYNSYDSINYDLNYSLENLIISLAVFMPYFIFMYVFYKVVMWVLDISINTYDRIVIQLNK